MTDEGRNSEKAYQKRQLKVEVGREFTRLTLTEPEFIRHFKAIRKIDLEEERILCWFVLAYEEVSPADIYEAGELLMAQSSPTIFDLQVVLAFSLSDNQKRAADKAMLNHPDFRGVVLEAFYKLFTCI
ncbi:hypothetical protein HN958_03605 [Candidatus Falkowbacteria bacterium]|nr:hypothetical protein [Candidatus Falkowbacteria bacterium]